MSSGGQGWGPPDDTSTSGPPTTAAWYPAGAARPPQATGPVHPTGPPAPPQEGAPAFGGPPPPAPSRRPSTRLLLLILAAVVVVVGAGVGVGVAVGSGSDPAPTSTPLAGASTPDFPSPTNPVTSASESESVEVTSAPPTTAAPTVSPSGIDIAAIGADPRAPAVTTVFDTYFTGINTHDPVLATSVFAAGSGLDPSDPGKVATFGEQTATTTDSDIVIRSIVTSATGIDVAVSFTSRQAAAFGPDGQTCTQWQIVYQLVAVGTQFQIVKGKATSQGC